MTPELFFKTDELAVTRTGKEDFIRRITDWVERFDLPALFVPFSEGTLGPITTQACSLRQALDGITPGLIEKVGLPLRTPGKGQKQIERYKTELAGDGNKSLQEIVAIGLQAGVLYEPAEIHIDDACGGNGILAIGLANLRARRALRTAGIAWERNPNRTKRHELLRHTLAKHNTDLTFVRSDVRHANLQRKPDTHTVCLAKHACGPATDAILANLATHPALLPAKTVLLTCCHGLAQNHSPFGDDPSLGITPETWRELTKTADWVTHPTDLDARMVGVVAMRIIDTLRARYLTLRDDFMARARVHELLPSSVSMKNQAIVLKPH